MDMSMDKITRNISKSQLANYCIILSAFKPEQILRTDFDNLKANLRLSMPDNFVSKVYFVSTDSANYQKLFKFSAFKCTKFIFFHSYAEFRGLNVNIE